MNSKSLTYFSFSCLLSGLVWSAPAGAQAPDDDPIAKAIAESKQEAEEPAAKDPVARATELNQEAIEAFKGKKFDQARKLLKQALDLCESSGLAQHPVKARTHIHMGIVNVAGLKQRAAGLEQFRKALEIQPEISLTKALITPDLQKAFDEAKGKPEEVKAPAPKPEEAAPAFKPAPKAEEAKAPPPAEPKSEEAKVAAVTQLNREAVDAYKNQRFDDARRLLKQALDMCDSSGLSQHPVKARTHIHFGIVLIGGFKQRDGGLKQFKKALEIQGDITLTKALVTADLQKAFDEAKSGGGGEATAKADEPPPPPDKPAEPPSGGEPSEGAVPSKGLEHEVVTRGKPGSDIPIEVEIEGDLKFDKLVLAYRSTAEGDYLGREMKQTEPGVFAADIPSKATKGDTVSYYIEAQDAEGNPIAAHGSEDKPLVITLTKRVASADDEDEEDEEDDEEDDENKHKFFVSLMVGSGAGYAAGNGDTDQSRQYSAGGFAVAQAGHIAPEIGYWFRRDLMLSLQLRYQRISGPTDFVVGNMTYHAARDGLAAFAKASWLFGEGSIHPFFSLALGGGAIRHVVKHPTQRDCGARSTSSCIDTITGGPVLAGAGGGIMVNLGDTIALVAAANTQVGVPNFSLNIDANIGVAFGF